MPEAAGAMIQHPDQWRELRELEAAIHGHAEWFMTVHRSLVCGRPPETGDLEEDAHRRCRFGQWYYGAHDSGLDEQTAFRDLEETHREMHDLTRAVLRQRLAGGNPECALYDAFVTQSHLFSTQMRALQFVIMGERYDIDPLTGVPSRRSMLPRLEQELLRAERDGQTCTLCMVDFDRFKSINDTWGHLAGDEVLRRGIAAVREQLRGYDLIFRYGGEEFLLVFPNSTLEQGARIAERIRLALADTPIRLPVGEVVHVTASIGLATAASAASLVEAIERADQALRAAKGNGRNQVRQAP